MSEHEWVSIAPPSSATGTENCILHPFEVADHICHQCGHWHCDGCVVHPWGPRKAALCVSCAIGKSGVRRNAGMSASRSPREIRQIERRERKESRDAARRPVVITSHGIDRSVPLPVAEVTREKRSLLSRLRTP